MSLLRNVALGAAMLCASAAAQAVVAVDQVTLVPRPMSSDVTFSGSAINNRQIGVNGNPNTYQAYQAQTQSLTVGVTGTLDRIALQIFGVTSGARINLAITRGYLFNPDGSGVDDIPDPIATFNNLSVPTNALSQNGAIVLVNLSQLGLTVTRGEVLSLGVTAAAGSGASWVFGSYSYDADTDTQTPIYEVRYAGGYNVIESRRYYGPNDPRNTDDQGVSGLDRGFITWVNATTSAGNPLTGGTSGPNGAETFSFTAGAGERVFIDPVYATGFDYLLNSGANIVDVLFPALASDADGYSIFDLNNNLLGTAMAGQAFQFAPGGVGGFRVRGIDGLEQGASFVTGLTFAAAGTVSITQTPVLAGAVPEPASWALMIGGFGLAGGALRRRARVAAAMIA